MRRRGFTFGAFFASIGATIGKALGYDGTPLKNMPEGIDQFIKTTTGIDSQYSIKIGRKIMVLPRGVMGEGGWDVYADTPETALRAHQEADAKEKTDQERYEFYQQQYAPDMLSPPLPRERLSLVPENVRHWSENPFAIKPHIDGPTYATIDDLRQLRDDLDSAQRLPEEILRSTVFDLWRRLDQAINKRESFCNGHNGPALGLTAHHAMTDMGDGRRLCPYCYNKEIADGRAGGTDEGRLTS